MVAILNFQSVPNLQLGLIYFTMGDFNFDLQNKNFRFSEFMEHTFSSKQIVSKVTRKYESLFRLGISIKVYPAKFYQVSDYRLSRAYSL
jgi:hypothetical protein